MSDDQVLGSASPGGMREWAANASASLESIVDDLHSPALLRQILTLVLAWQARNTTQVGRALVSPRIAPQWLAGLLALGATVTVSAAEGGLDEVPLEDALRDRPDGTIEMLHVPAGVASSKWGEAHVSRTRTDEPIVAAVAVVSTKGQTVQLARVALTGAWPQPVRLAESIGGLVGSLLSLESISDAARLVEKEAAPRGDIRGSAEYRRAMAYVMTRRALEQCLG